MKVSRTETRAYVYEVKAQDMKEAIEKIESGNAIKKDEFTTDVFYQIEEV